MGLSTSTQASGYTRTAIALHWLIAVALAGSFALGLYMHELPVSQQLVQASQLAALVTSSVRSFRARCAIRRLLTASRVASSSASRLPNFSVCSRSSSR